MASHVATIMKTEYLDPQTTTFETAPDGTMRVAIMDDRCALRVEAFRAFPLSHPEMHIVLRDGLKNEIGIVRDLKELPEQPRELLRMQLQRRYFLPKIKAITKIFERFGTMQWEIETDRGARSVTTKPIQDAIFEIEPGRFLLTDNESNRYEIENLNDFDAESRALFLGKN